MDLFMWKFEKINSFFLTLSVFCWYYFFELSLPICPSQNIVCVFVETETTSFDLPLPSTKSIVNVLKQTLKLIDDNHGCECVERNSLVRHLARK